MSLVICKFGGKNNCGRKHMVLSVIFFFRWYHFFQWMSGVVLLMPLKTSLLSTMTVPTQSFRHFKNQLYFSLLHVVMLTLMLFHITNRVWISVCAA